MDNKKYEELLKLIKIFEKRRIEFPDYGKQNFHNLIARDNNQLTFRLLINRKGHLREDNLTYQMESKEYGILIRLDMTGPSHSSTSGKLVNTPHVHIFDESHNDGKRAIPLSEINDQDIINTLHDSLLVFLLYNNVSIDDIEIPFL